MGEHNCQFVLAINFVGEDFTFCDRPASLKIDSVWLCTEHYDYIESGKPTNYIAHDPIWLPYAFPDLKVGR